MTIRRVNEQQNEGGEGAEEGEVVEGEMESDDEGGDESDEDESSPGGGSSLNQSQSSQQPLSQQQPPQQHHLKSPFSQHHSSPFKPSNPYHANAHHPHFHHPNPNAPPPPVMPPHLLPPGLLSSLQSLHHHAANLGDLVALATDETTGIIILLSIQI